MRTLTQVVFAIAFWSTVAAIIFYIIGFNVGRHPGKVEAQLSRAWAWLKTKLHRHKNDAPS